MWSLTARVRRKHRIELNNNSGKSAFEYLNNYSVKFIPAIIFLLSFFTSQGQQKTEVCNCIQKPRECIPEISRREIVRKDTLPAHHSYCYEIHCGDKNLRAVALLFVCDEKPTDPFLLRFFDSTTLGTRIETWFDTSGKSVYFTRSEHTVVKECYWYHYPPEQENYDYIMGFRDGGPFKEIYTWDEYGASYIKKVTITPNEIRTKIYTDERDAYGYIIWKIVTEPNCTGKVLDYLPQL
jgi:hypothetical protein